MHDIIKWPVSRLAAALQKKEVSSQEVTTAYLEEIAAKDDSIGAYLTITADHAQKQAAAIDQKRAAGEALAPLAGVPAGIKDNMCTEGVLTTCASKMLCNFVPPYTATAVLKLQKSGIVMLGKLNMDEFAMGSSTENSYFRITRNPRNPEYVPGGSSGGSAAAVAANEAAFALGSDTGGSIRQPAAFCGVVGMKPTYGSVSRYGLIAFASSLDQIGPLTKTVTDSALVMNLIAGHDAQDATSVRRSYDDFTAKIGSKIDGMKLALPVEFLGDGISQSVKAGILQAAETYRKLGAEVSEVSIASLSHALPAYYVISSAEASSNLARFDGVKYGYRSETFETIDDLYKNSRSEGFGKEVQRRIMLGSFALSSGYYDAYYKKALQVRTLIVQDFNRIFEQFDLILAPVAPTTAYRIGEKTQSPLEMYLGDICTVPVNIAGLPALSLPCGTDAQGLPIGMQLIGRPFDEARIYQVGYAYEQAVSCTREG